MWRLPPSLGRRDRCFDLALEADTAQMHRWLVGLAPFVALRPSAWGVAALAVVGLVLLGVCANEFKAMAQQIVKVTQSKRTIFVRPVI